jgi:hypothetical protein
MSFEEVTNYALVDDLIDAAASRNQIGGESRLRSAREFLLMRLNDDFAVERLRAAGYRITKPRRSSDATPLR